LAHPVEQEPDPRPPEAEPPPRPDDRVEDVRLPEGRDARIRPSITRVPDVITPQALGEPGGDEREVLGWRAARRRGNGGNR
jgi:hypothetical protein